MGSHRSGLSLASVLRDFPTISRLECDGSPLSDNIPLSRSWELDKRVPDLYNYPSRRLLLSLHAG